MARPRDPEERAKRVAQLERKARTRRALTWAAVALAALVVIGGVAYGLSKAPKPAKSVHWHAKYQVWVDDQELSFSNSKFDANVNQNFYLPAHMHGPNFDVIHNEGKEGEGTMGKFFQFGLSGGLLTDNELVIPSGAALKDTGAPFSGDFKVEGNKTLQFWVSNQVTNESWTQVTSNLAGFSFHDGDRILVLYGDYTPARVQEIQAQFPNFDPSQVE